MLKRILKSILIIIGAALTAIVLLLGAATVFEYTPDDVETLEVRGENDAALKPGDTIKIATWNVGYGCLGEEADFFMDGGSKVKTADKARTEENIDAVTSWLKSNDFDVVALQEVDVKSHRSNNVNEVQTIDDALSDHNSVFARNFKAFFVPYPVPPIGSVDSGIMTLSKYSISEAHRNSLPCPFSWPIRTCNLKRCAAVSHIPLDGTDRELLIVNLHLEAYDSGEGKIAQTNMLRSLLEEESQNGNYVIALGDFNQSFSNVDSSAYPIQEGMWAPGRIDSEDFGDFQMLMDNKTPTCRSLDKALAGADTDSFQFYLIDGAIVSSNIDVKSIKTNDLGFVNTDHNPVSLELTLKE